MQQHRFPGGHFQIDDGIVLRIFGLICFGDKMLGIEHAQLMATRYNLHTTVGNRGIIQRSPDCDDRVAV